MANQIYNAVKRADGQVIRAFRAIEEELGAAPASLQVRLSNEHSEPTVALSAVSTTDDTKDLVESDVALVWRLRLRLPSKQWPGCIVDVVRQADHDEISIHFQNELAFQNANRFVKSVKTHLPGFEGPASVDKTLGSELTEFFRRREASVLRLEDLTDKLIRQNEEYRRQTDERTEQLREKLVNEQQSFLEKTRQESDRKEAELKAREDALATKLKDVDDRDSRHVRRQIRKELKDNLAAREKQFKLSQSTNEKRVWIHLQFLFLILISLWVAYSGFANLSEKDPYSYVRFIVGLVGLATSTVFYIRWSDIWFRQHADEEFRLRRLELDIDRASWVVEMGLEWKQQKGEDIPPELVDRLTKNLFADPRYADVPKHPAEDFAAALLNASANLKVNLPGGAGELNIDRKGIRSLT